MATRIPPQPVPDRELHGLDRADLLEMHRIMLTARTVDDREESLKRQNRVFFQISGAGHEAIQVAMARHLRPGADWVFPYYRSRALTLAMGQTPLEHLLQSVAAEDDTASRGRQMPTHYSDPELRIVSASSCTGSQYLHAVGAAEGAYRARLAPELAERVDAFEEDEIALVCSGDGATSEGEFWEALNTACNLRLPVLFLIEDNEYAISVPVEVQTPGGDIARIVSGFPDLRILRCDGTDLLDSHRASAEAVRYCREGRGPALLHAKTIRLYSHSMSDDERMYRAASELARERERDPILRSRTFLLEEGLADELELTALEGEVTATVAEAVDEALTRPQPPAATATRWLYSEEVDPTSEAFDTEETPEYGDAREYTMVDLLNQCLRDEMERDPRVLCFGQDVADASREEILSEVPGKGGVFKVTHGLQRRFGSTRVFNSPLAEANIVGRAIGLALRGYRPVVEIQFFDYIWPAFHQIRNELATLRYRSGNGWAAPIVIRAPFGGYLRGGSIYHSQTGASIFAHTPGLRVVLPATAQDANGLLRTAIRCEDPVLFLEHKHLYRQVHNKGRYPGSEFMIPFGKARLIRPGADLTIVACGALVRRAEEAAREASDRHGIEAEILDLRTITPLDMDRIAESVKKTSRVLVAHEDPISFGLGAEVAARIADELFEWLDAPVRRIGSKDVWVAYSPQLEEAILPQAADVLRAIRELAAY